MKTPVLKCNHDGTEVREDNTEVWYANGHSYFGVLCPKCSTVLAAEALN